ncbi:MAG: D-alanyl-D-alanine carboxypeptidase/D-alanyl-D-alanine endopeptidase [Nocardioidaceae bacterium]
MAKGDRHHSERPRIVGSPGSGRLLRASTAGLVVLVLVLAAAALQFDLGTRWFGWEEPSAQEEPAEVAPPPGLSLPEPQLAPAVAEHTADRAADPAKVRRAVAKLVADKKLGKHVAVAVNQLSDGTTLYDSGAGLVTPASTMKMLTSTAALESLGQGHRFRTTVVVGSKAKEIVLVGGGDPLLGSRPDAGAYPVRADVQTLARAAAKKVHDLGMDKVRLGYDTSLFSGPAASPDWPASYITDNVVTPISALWVDQGRGSAGTADGPPLDATRAFAKELEKRDVKVMGAPRPAVAPADATELAAVQSAPLEQVVQYILEYSDNEGAEVLLRHVALAEGEPGSFKGGATALRSVLGRLGVDTAGETILDGSGLSREDRLRPGTLLSVIGLASSDELPHLRPVATDLPVAGFTGSLEFRFETGAAEGLGRVRAKTGTLTGVHGLAGVTTTIDGAELAFVAIADRVKVANTLDARATIDEITAALAACSCAAAG